MAIPLEAPQAEPDDGWCPGGGDPPAGTKGSGPRYIYGGGCGTCGRQVTVDDSFRTRPHRTIAFIHGIC